MLKAIQRIFPIERDARLARLVEARADLERSAIQGPELDIDAWRAAAMMGMSVYALDSTMPSPPVRIIIWAYEQARQRLH